MRRSTAAIAAVGLAAAAVLIWRARSTIPESPRAETQPEPAPRAAPAPSPSARRPIQPAPIGDVAPRRDEPRSPSEPALMAALRDVGGTAPERSIALARDGQRRFPNSADAPERAFIIVQSLVNLRRFHEARDAAREMVRKYPDNPFALDAQRHLLVYPLDQPSREEMQQQTEGRAQ